MLKSKQVAIAFPLGEPHLALFLRGITKYAQQHGGWTLTVSPETSSTSLASWTGWPGNGLFVLANTPAEARAVREMRMPVVNLSGTLREAGLPRVMVDHEAVGRLAAEHLLARGFRRFGFYGGQRVWHSQQRKRGFIESISHVGGECSTLEMPSNVNTRQAWRDWQEPLEEWLKTLQTPVGVMAATDPRGTAVLQACGRLGLKAPDDVALIGVDNNEVICESCPTPLSSVSRSAETVGYEAAVVMDRLMEGGRPPAEDILIPPDGVVERRSTDVLAVEDPRVAAAVRFVREHVDQVFGIERLLPVTRLSRQWLTHRFKKSLGCTPHEFVCRTRVERARLLLADPKKPPLQEIAQACGFSESRRFRLVFQRLTGSTPNEYRRSLH